MGLGSARDLGLAEARAKARREREKLAGGVDPLELKRQERDAQRAAAAKQITFQQAAERYHEAHQASWSSAHYSNEFLGSLKRWAFPHIGALDVAAIGRDEVLRVLEQKLKRGDGTFWVKRAITADRTRNRIERVLDWAAVRGFRTGDNPARWRGFLQEVLPAPRKNRPVQHLHAVPYDEVPAVMAGLAADATVAAQALRFAILTACRIGEAVGATWDEIDLDAAEWVIPAARMKSRREHRVPLSPQAVELLRGLYREEGNPSVFISVKTPGATVSKGTVLQALRRIGRAETVHGFRAAFSTWASERTRFALHVAELSLAHAVGSAVERAYRRTDLYLQRRKLMEAWGLFCTTPRAEEAAKGKVVPLRRERTP
jgi:integrase